MVRFACLLAFSAALFFPLTALRPHAGAHYGNLPLAGETLPAVRDLSAINRAQTVSLRRNLTDWVTKSGRYWQRNLIAKILMNK
jgi:hypothetical protein